MAEQNGGRGSGERIWAVGPNPETGTVDEEELARLSVDVTTVLRMVGGVASFWADRVQDRQTGQWFTRSVGARWHSYAPPGAPAQPQAAPPPPEELRHEVAPADALEEELGEDAYMPHEEPVG